MWTSSNPHCHDLALGGFPGHLKNLCYGQELHFMVLQMSGTKQKKMKKLIKVHVALKKCSTVLIIREIQIQVIMRYHFPAVRMSIFETSTNSQSVLERVWRRRSPSMLLVGMQRGPAAVENNCMEDPYNTKNEATLMLQSHSWACIWRKL